MPSAAPRQRRWGVCSSRARCFGDDGAQKSSSGARISAAQVMDESTLQARHGGLKPEVPTVSLNCPRLISAWLWRWRAGARSGTRVLEEYTSASIRFGAATSTSGAHLQRTWACRFRTHDLDSLIRIATDPGGET